MTAMARLFLRSRGITVALIAIVAVNLVGLLFTSARIERAGSGYGIPWLLFLPFLSSCVIGISMRSPLDELDRMGARSLVPWRLGQLVVLFTPALSILVVVAGRLTGPATEFAAVRNLVGLVGLALITGRLVGSRLSWLPGFLWCIAAASLGDPLSTLPSWDWLVRSDDDYQAAVLAWALGLLGFCLGATGTREFRWSSSEPVGRR